MMHNTREQGWHPTWLTYGLTVWILCTTSAVFAKEKKVHEIVGSLGELATVDVTDPQRFLNDLMLSPLWKVEKDRDGTFFASARCINAGEFTGERNGKFICNTSAPCNVRRMSGIALFSRLK